MILIPCGLYWTRTSDPIDVNDVLYQLSQQTITGNERHYIMHFVFGQGKNNQKAIEAIVSLLLMLSGDTSP